MPTAVAVSVWPNVGVGSLRHRSVHDACSAKIFEMSAVIAALLVMK